MKLKIGEYEKVIKNFLQQHDIGMKIIISDSPNPFYYVPSKIALKVNLMAVNRYINKGIHAGLTDEEVIQIMVCHELGHYRELFFNPFIDPVRVKEEETQEDWNRFIIERELGAWRYGEHFVPEHLLEEYNKLNENNMEIYREQYPC